MIPLKDENGMLTESALDELKVELDWADAIAIGMGMGQNKAIEIVIKQLLSKYKKPLVLDAMGEIRRTHSIPAREITSPESYLERRTFLRRAGLVAAVNPPG